MKIRTQLVVAFLLLGVLPLAGIVVYTFLSSQAALRRAFEAEAAEAAADMQERLADVSDSVESRFASLGHLQSLSLEASEAATAGKAVSAQILRGLGEVAPFIERIQLVPEPPAPPGPGQPPGSVAPEAPALSFEVPEMEIRDDEDLAEAMKELEELGPLGQIIEFGLHTAFRVAAGELETRLESGEERTPEELEAMTEVREELERAREQMAETRREERRLRREERREVRALAPVDRRDGPPAFEVPVTEEGRVVGRLRGEIRARTLLERVLTLSGREAGEIPYAIDADGELLPASEEDRALLEELPLDGWTGVTTWSDEWVIARNRDEESGLVVGIVRPIGEPLRNVRRTAVLNFSVGLGLVGFALLAVLFLSGRMSRQVRAIAEGAERVARGDLQTRVPVRTRNELGQLAASFNRMAEDLSRQQQRLVEEEMRRRENELEQEMLRREYERKSGELEEARRFQLSLLPDRLPTVPGLDLAVHMKTAAEVGGDYYDFRTDGDELLVTIGDATGHGARAGTMVTIVKSYFAGRSLHDLPSFLADANHSIRSMGLGRMAMALALARFRGRRLTVSSAGMPPVLIHRRDGSGTEEIALPGTPLGSLPFDYLQKEVELADGDTILLMSDGFAELTDPEGDSLGYDETRRLFAEACDSTGEPREILQRLLDAGEGWTAGEPIRDDVTFLVVRIT